MSMIIFRAGRHAGPSLGRNRLLREAGVTPASLVLVIPLANPTSGRGSDARAVLETAHGKELENQDGGKSWVPFLSKSRADQYPGPRLAGDGPRSDRLHRCAVQGDCRGMLCRPEARVQDRPDYSLLYRL